VGSEDAKLLMMVRSNQLRVNGYVFKCRLNAAMLRQSPTSEGAEIEMKVAAKVKTCQARSVKVRLQGTTFSGEP